MAEFLSFIIRSFTTCIIGDIAANIRDLRDLKDNIEQLESTKEKLKGRRKGEKEKLKEAKKQKGVEASVEANRWFTQVDKAVSDADSLKAEYEDHQPFPNCFCYAFSRLQLSQSALKLKQAIENLYNQDLKSGWTAAPTSQKGGRELDTVSIEGQSTTEKLKGDIINAVVDDRYVVVGLHGMGGVGKTTLIRHAYNHFRNTDHFKYLIFTTVSATPNFVEIRKEIARSLGLEVEKDVDDNDVKQKLSRLSSSDIGKYLLILDDMWKPPIDIREICIPAPNKDNGCKILMASRSSSVVTNFVIRFAARDSLKSIAVNSLPPKEAWNLFVQKVGEEITCKPEIKPLAVEIVRKCDGLPLAIAVVGGTMATRETKGEWKDAVRELEQSASKFEGIEEEVFSKLIFSFEKLRPIEQSLFLNCCLFPEDCIIPQEFLVVFAMDEETFEWDEMQDNLGDVSDKVDVLIGKLRNSSMLEDAGNGEVKMHDVMRALALSITSSNKYHYTTKLKFIAKAGRTIGEVINAPGWAQANKISFYDNDDIKSLPELPHLCPQLNTLLLGGCRSITEMPQVHFLDHMPALRILDLSQTKVKYLPPSISNLVNLRILSLSLCKFLERLPPEIGMLVQLIWLDLDYCYCLSKLPVEMKKLKNLRRLNFEESPKLKRIPRGVLSGLVKLEELRAEFLDTDSIMELSQLTRLTNTKIGLVEIKEVKVSHWLKPLISKGIRYLTLRNCDIDPSALSDSENLHIEVVFKSCKGLTRVPTHGYNSLTVQDCPDLKALLMVEEEVERRNINAFQILLWLELHRLDELETICIGIPQPGFRCFTNLRKIVIHDCPNLKVLFTKGVTRLLTKLRVLHVHRCSQLVKLAVSDDDEAFPSSEFISLCELPELTAICDLDLKWPSLYIAHIYLCPKLRRPPFGARRADISLNDEIDSEMTQDYLNDKQKRMEEKEKEEKEEEEEDDDGDEEKEDG